MYKLCVFIPEFHLDIVKDAMFGAGAGKIGNYESCCWHVLGEGQFKPLKNSQPFIGQQDKVETVAEYKVELVVEEHLIEPVIQAMKQSHPYEEPAYDIIILAKF